MPDSFEIVRYSESNQFLFTSSTTNKTQKMPLLSVAVITYNHVKFIADCLRGIIMQKTNFEIEIVVADDNSTDGTREVIKEFERQYPDLIKPIYQTRNVGGARNAYEYCYPATRGKYIGVCEGDDVWTDPFKLQKQVDFLENNPDYVMAFHRVNSIDENGRELSCQMASDPIYYSQSEIFHISINTLSVVFRKCFNEVTKDIYRVRSGDTFLFGLLATYGKAVDLGFIGASYRRHSTGVYNSLGYVEQVMQGIQTRRAMHSSEAFSLKFKLQLRWEILRRKWVYGIYFAKRKQVNNFIKIAFA